MQENFLVKNAKLITIINSVGIVFCICLLIFVVINKEFSKSTYLSLQFAPSNAVLTLDNGTELHTGTYEFQPGHYSGTLTSKGFDSKNIDFDIAPRQTNSITNYLVHSTEGLSYFEKNAANIDTLRLIPNDSDLANFLEAYDHKVSIYDQLPFYANWLKHPNDYSTYTIEITDGRNKPECHETLCLLAVGPKDNRDEIAKTLSDKGYDINNYEIIYEQAY